MAEPRYDIKISELQEITALRGVDKLVINQEDTVTLKISYDNFINDFTSRNLVFTGSVYVTGEFTAPTLDKRHLHYNQVDNVSELINDVGYLVRSDLNNYIQKGDNVSLLENDAGYITQGHVENILNGGGSTGASYLRKGKLDNVSELINDEGYITGIDKLDEIGDVNVLGATANQFLVYDGNEWVAKEFPVIASLLKFQGVIDVTMGGGPSTNGYPGYQAMAGHYWIVERNGTADSYWNGLTTVREGDRVLFARDYLWYQVGNINDGGDNIELSDLSVKNTDASKGQNSSLTYNNTNGEFHYRRPYLDDFLTEDDIKKILDNPTDGSNRYLKVADPTSLLLNDGNGDVINGVSYPFVTELDLSNYLKKGDSTADLINEGSVAGGPDKYAELSDLPTHTNELSNNGGTRDPNYDEKNTFAYVSELPTKTSDLTNDGDGSNAYLTESEVNNILNGGNGDSYVTTSDIDTSTAASGSGKGAISHTVTNGVVTINYTPAQLTRYNQLSIKNTDPTAGQNSSLTYNNTNGEFHYRRPYLDAFITTSDINTSTGASGTGKGAISHTVTNGVVTINYTPAELTEFSQLSATGGDTSRGMLQYNGSGAFNYIPAQLNRYGQLQVMNLSPSNSAISGLTYSGGLFTYRPPSLDELGGVANTLTITNYPTPSGAGSIDYDPALNELTYVPPVIPEGTLAGLGDTNIPDSITDQATLIWDDNSSEWVPGSVVLTPPGVIYKGTADVSADTPVGDEVIGEFYIALANDDTATGADVADDGNGVSNWPGLAIGLTVENGEYIMLTNSGWTIAGSFGQNAPQSNYAESDPNQPSFIKNKPNIPAPANNGSLTITPAAGSEVSSGTTTFTADATGDTPLKVFSGKYSDLDYGTDLNGDPITPPAIGTGTLDIVTSAGSSLLDVGGAFSANEADGSVRVATLPDFALSTDLSDLSNSLSDYVKKAGDTMTGNLTFQDNNNVVASINASTGAADFYSVKAKEIENAGDGTYNSTTATGNVMPLDLRKLPALS